MRAARYMRHSRETIEWVRDLRKRGSTFSEIEIITKVPRKTAQSWCKEIKKGPAI